MGNQWLEHVKQYRLQNPSLSYKEALKGAKQTYKKSTGAGACCEGKSKAESCEMCKQHGAGFKDKVLSAGKKLLKGVKKIGGVTLKAGKLAGAAYLATYAAGLLALGGAVALAKICPACEKAMGKKLLSAVKSHYKKKAGSPSAFDDNYPPTTYSGFGMSGGGVVASSFSQQTGEGVIGDAVGAVTGAVGSVVRAGRNVGRKAVCPKKTRPLFKGENHFVCANYTG